MRKATLILLTAVVIYLLVTPLAFGQGAKTDKAKGGSAKEQIEALQVEITQAQLKGDISALEKLYADDVMIIHSDGKRSTKAREFANIKAGSQKYEPSPPLEQTIHIYGGTAVVNSVFSTKVTVGGKPFAGNTCTSRVWVKQKGNWKNVLYQVTRVLPANQ